MTETEQRRAAAGASVYLDVLLHWRAAAEGGFRDDDWPAGIDWITRVIPEVESGPPARGWLCVRDTATPGIGWQCGAVFSLSSLRQSLKGKAWPVKRRDFREAARLSGVSLPSAHALACLDEVRCPKCRNVYRREQSHYFEPHCWVCCEPAISMQRALAS